MTRASYRHAVHWIAVNDETAEEDAERIAALISVCLIADIFGKTPDAVARDVLRNRKRAHGR